MPENTMYCRKVPKEFVAVYHRAQLKVKSLVVLGNIVYETPTINLYSVVALTTQQLEARM